MDTSQLPFAKGRPAALERQDRRVARKSADEAENKKVRMRSGGLCEVQLVLYRDEVRRVTLRPRCPRRAHQIHHMIGGWGKRARASSLLAEHKQHVCADCHTAITGHVLKRLGGVTPLWTDRYERVE